MTPFAIRRATTPAALLAMTFTLSACHPFGARQVPIDRFDYNAAVAKSSNEQMLLNLVRLHYSEVPVFLALNSVLTQYVWSGDVAANGSSGQLNGFPAWNVGGNATLRYFERPTITYSPLSGQEFAAQLISPVRPDLVFSLAGSGWSPRQLFVMTLQRINDVANVGSPPTIGEAPERSGEFPRLVALTIELARRSSIEITRETAANKDETYLEFRQDPDPSTKALIDEFKGIAGLDRTRSRFRVTRKILGRAPDEVTIRMNSLLDLMGILSTGVDTDMDKAATSGGSATAPSTSELTAAMPLRVHCQRERPTTAFVAVRYADRWFFISQSDEQSKRAFGLLTYLFQMQAPQQQGAGPLITVPTG